MIRDLEANHCPGEMFSKKAGKLQTQLSKKKYVQTVIKRKGHIS